MNTELKEISTEVIDYISKDDEIYFIKDVNEGQYHPIIEMIVGIEGQNKNER